MSLLDIKNLNLSFGTAQVLRDISLTIDEGEMVAIVGESGSGKSLTALSCLGLQPPGAQISGSITLAGTQIINAPEGSLRSLRGIVSGMIFQEPMTALNPLHTIGKQVGEMIQLHQPKNTRIKDKVIALFQEVGLEKLVDRLNAYPHELSGGERQRVMIAMAIANSPQLLIADEPTTAVDVTVQSRILKLLKELQHSRKMAIMFITHDLTLVRRLADKVVVMKEGKIVEMGTVAQVFENPQQNYTKTLLASEPGNFVTPLPQNTKITLLAEHLKVYFPIKSGVFRRISGFIKAVDEISIPVPESSTLGIVGESGSGKSTLGFALLRLVNSEGKVVWMGRDIGHFNSKMMRPLRKEMQLVFQDPYSSLNPRMHVGQILREGLTVHEPHARDHESRIADILSEVGLPADVADRYPHEFSGGQRQRIAIARAMILKPKFVVLDEPTSALDLTVQKQILELLHKFQKNYGISYLFISHDLRVVRAISHHIAVLHKGHLVEYGTAQDIMERPREEYTKRLIDAALLKG